MNKELIITEDGSHSLYVPELKEHYHSTHGAIQESKHVFIESGYNFIAPHYKSLNILEIGFGTGLNAFLTYIASAKTSKKINYIGVEPYPIDELVYTQMNFADLVGSNKNDVFLKMHQTNWRVPYFINDFFILNKIMEKIEDVSLMPGQMQLVYFDAFAPEVQPELWEKEVFEKLYEAMSSNSVLVTYCAKGEVKRNLKQVGFEIESIPGPKGKREITRALKK